MGTENALGGELLVPKIPSYRITDVAEAIGQIAQNPSLASDQAKIHEEMITASDSFSTIDLGPYYAILPSDGSVQAKYTEKACRRGRLKLTLPTIQAQIPIF